MNYQKLYYDEELNHILDSINKINKDVLFACHGREHTMSVVNMVACILNQLGYDEHTIELGKIAGLLHDIGVIRGKKNHAKRSSEMASVYLDKIHLSVKDKGIIKSAILDHSKGENISSAIGASLLIADKIDVSDNRILPFGKKQSHFFMKGIENITLTVENEEIGIEYQVNEKFNKEIFFQEHKYK